MFGRCVCKQREYNAQKINKELYVPFFALTEETNLELKKLVGAGGKEKVIDYSIKRLKPILDKFRLYDST